MAQAAVAAAQAQQKVAAAAQQAQQEHETQALQLVMKQQQSQRDADLEQQKLAVTQQYHQMQGEARMEQLQTAHDKLGLEAQQAAQQALQQQQYQTEMADAGDDEEKQRQVAMKFAMSGKTGTISAGAFRPPTQAKVPANVEKMEMDGKNYLKITQPNGSVHVQPESAGQKEGTLSQVDREELRDARAVINDFVKDYTGPGMGKAMAKNPDYQAALRNAQDAAKTILQITPNDALAKSILSTGGETPQAPQAKTSKEDPLGLFK
jgi:hypothetical protein